MTICNPENERLKRRFLNHQKAAGRKSEKSLDRIAASIDRFQRLTGFKPFSKFHVELVISFRNKLDNEVSSRTGKPLSASVLKAVLADCKAFFLWLADQPGYRSRIRYADCEYFNLDNKSKAIANASRMVNYPSVDQVEHVLRSMPENTDIHCRDRALIAFAFVTGARIDALRTAKLGAVDLVERVFHQDAREMNTKFSKTFDTWFAPISDLATEIVVSYVSWLQSEMLFDPGDPLFPKTRVAHVEGKGFQATGLQREHWSQDNSIRKVFRKSFEQAGLKYFSPHSFRHTLAATAKAYCKSPDELQAWAQNHGQESAATLVKSYGKLTPEQQRDIIRNFKPRKPGNGS